MHFLEQLASGYALTLTATKATKKASGASIEKVDKLVTIRSSAAQLALSACWPGCKPCCRACMSAAGHHQGHLPLHGAGLVLSAGVKLPAAFLAVSVSLHKQGRQVHLCPAPGTAPARVALHGQRMMRVQWCSGCPASPAHHCHSDACSHLLAGMSRG